MTEGTGSTTLYDDDIVAWSDEQVAALRRLAEEMRPNSRDLDFENIIEEIGDVGRAQIEKASSQIVNILTHWLMAAFDPDAPALGHWRGEVEAFITQLMLAYAPSMRQRIDMGWAWRRALRTAAAKLAAHGVALPAGLPEDCPFTLAELVEAETGWDAALARLRGLAGA